MTDLVKIALISAAGGALPSILGFINNLRIKEGFRSVHTKMDQTSSEVKDLTSQVNGKMNRLLEVTGDARQAIGNLAGHAEEKAGVSAEHCANFVPKEESPALLQSEPSATAPPNIKKKKP
jgi:outer membrane murein-binding lipoprotein Lpp